MVNHSQYHPESYDLYRPVYPVELFDPIRSVWGRVLPENLNLLDLACGTGHVWRSVHPWTRALGTKWILMDPDPELLAIARSKAKQDAGSETKFCLNTMVATAEAIPLPSESADLVLCGSAWHWFKNSAVDEIHRILRPGGAIYVFEYQFPKMESDTLGLNEWVRRQFNEQWRFLEQVPRGNLQEKTENLRLHPQLSQANARSLVKVLRHTADFFSDMIFSQARYLDYESRIEKQKALDARTAVRKEVAGRFADPSGADFQYRFEGYLFQKRRV